MRQLLPLVLAATAIAAPPAAPTGVDPALAGRIMRLTRESVWRPAASVPIAFTTHHPQGLVKIGDTFFVSSVEIKVRTRRLAAPAGGYDRDTGEGIGHLFKMDASGKLLADLRLGEGAIYHPGGIDYDGRDIWVPVAEYRPNSRAIIYRVDPITMQATEVLRFADHLGGIVHNTDDRTLHGVSWGSRRFYRWTLDRSGRVTNAGARPEALRALNRSHYVDYQDCKYIGGRRMACTGIAEIRRTPEDATPFRLGGLELVDLRDGRPLHQVPVLLWTRSGLNMTHNAAWFESRETGVRAYFLPEDDTSTLYVFDVSVD